MDASHSVEALQAMPLCQGLDRESAERMLALARPLAFRAGARLTRQGAPARGAYVVRAGSVEARVAMPGGGEHAVATLGEGSMFGEMSLIERGICSASVVALTDVEGWFIEREDFRALVASRSPVALAVQRALARALAEKLSALNAHVLAYPAPEDRPAAPPPQARTASASPRTPQQSFDFRGFLPRLGFFEGFDEDEIDEFVARVRPIELARGAWLFAQDERTNELYVVVRGAVEIGARSGEGAERRLAVLGPGEPVGLLSLLGDRAHGASARIRESALLLGLSRAQFDSLYESGSGLAVRMQRAIHHSLLRALARTNNQLMRLISQARLREAAASEAASLEAALYAQVWQPE